MQRSRFGRWYTAPAMVVLSFVLAVVLAGCGSGSSSAGSGHSASPAAHSASPSAQSTESYVDQNVSAVKSAFIDFFSGKTPASRKVTLVQRGADFSPVIHKQAGGTMAQATTVKVLHVGLDSVDSATVRYTILLGGQPALKNQTGSAVKEDGKWKVASATFCRLLDLEQSAPPLCSSAS